MNAPEQGQTVGTAGVVELVSDRLEMRVNLDENNLAELAVDRPPSSLPAHLAERVLRDMCRRLPRRLIR